MKIYNLFLIFALTLIPFNNANAQLKDNHKKNNSETNNSELISPETKVDYNDLAELLSEGEWHKANNETRSLLLEAVGRKDIGWATTDNIKTLACWDLKTMDALWVKYSQGKFGFSVQLPIYLETGNRPGKLIGDNNYMDFGDRIGWRENNDWIIFIENLNYTLDAPNGHLPNPRSEYSITGGRLQYTTLAERMVQCHLKDESMKNE